MNSLADSAIGLLHAEVLNGDPMASLGTAFICSPSFALTAFHCIGDRETNQIKHPRVAIRLGGVPISGDVVEANSMADFAIIKLREPLPPGVRPLPLEQTVRNHSNFRSKGWPSARPFSSDPMTVSGQVTDPAATIFDGVHAIQLFCREAAAGLPLYGISGAPVLVEDQENASRAVGIMRWNPQSPSDHRVAYGGIAFACPLGAIIDNSDGLRNELGRDRQSLYIAYAEEDRQWAEFLHELMTSNGYRVTARFVFTKPGDAFRAKASETLVSFPNVLILVTANYEASDDPISIVEREMIEDHRGRRIPVLLMECEVPSFTSRLVPIDLRGEDDAMTWKRCALEGLYSVVAGPIAPSGVPFPLQRNDGMPIPIARDRPIRTLVDTTTMESDPDES